MNRVTGRYQPGSVTELSSAGSDSRGAEKGGHATDVGGHVSMLLPERVESSSSSSESSAAA
jgi:hypothetical protein